MNKKIYITILLFFLISGGIKAQEDICLKKVRQVYQEWASEIAANKEHPIYIKYNTKVTSGAINNLKKNSSTVEVISDQYNAIFLTKNLKVYQDKKYTVSILSDKKIIVINGYAGNQYKREKMGQMAVFQDSIFAHLTTEVCKTVSVGGKEYKRVILKTNAYAAKTFKIKSISFLLDEKQHSVKEMKVNYTKGYRLYTMEIQILKQNLNYQAAHFKKEVIFHVLNTKEELLSKYAGYELIDNRN